MVSPSQSLDRSIQKLIKESYGRAIEQIGQEEFFYIGKHIERKLASLKLNGTRWVRDLAYACDALNLLYQDHTDGLIQLPDDCLRSIGAALFYLVNPYDIVPDHVPGRGYLDDAYITNICINRLKKHDSDLFPSYLSRVMEASDESE